VKVFATFVLFLAFLVPTHADTFDVSASSIPCNQVIPCGPATINAVFGATEEFGTFFLLAFDESIQATEPVVTGITGTFNGLPMSLVAPPSNPEGIVGWMFLDLPQNVYFSAGGVTYILNWDGNGPPEIFSPSSLLAELNWSAPDSVAEPSTLLLLTVPLLLVLMRWAQMSLRKLSER
jgi:hypothetical protein